METADQHLANAEGDARRDTHLAALEAVGRDAEPDNPEAVA